MQSRKALCCDSPPHGSTSFYKFCRKTLFILQNTKILLTYLVSLIFTL